MALLRGGLELQAQVGLGKEPLWIDRSPGGLQLLDPGVKPTVELVMLTPGRAEDGADERLEAGKIVR